MAPRPTRSGFAKAITGRSQRRTTKTAPWRCRCSSTGCRARRTDGTHRSVGWWARCAFAHLQTSRLLEIEIRPDRHVVRRLLPGAHVAVHADMGQAVAGLRRQQQVVDPDTPVLLPGAGLVVPERVLARRVRD